MSFRKVFTAVLAGTALVAANVTAFAGAAQARDWRDGGSGYSRSDRGWQDGRRYGYDHGRGHHKKDKSDKKIARGIAIGLGVLLIGSILASEANR
jgi:hypothetical protein